MGLHPSLLFPHVHERWAQASSSEENVALQAYTLNVEGLKLYSKHHPTRKPLVQMLAKMPISGLPLTH